MSKSQSPKGYVSVTQEELIPMEEFLSAKVTDLQEQRSVMEEKYYRTSEKFREEVDKVINTEVVQNYYDYYYNKYVEVKSFVPEEVITGRKLFGIIPLKDKIIPEHTTHKTMKFNKQNFNKSLLEYLQVKLKDCCSLGISNGKVIYREPITLYHPVYIQTTLGEVSMHIPFEVVYPNYLVDLERDTGKVVSVIRELLSLQQTLADFIATGKTCHIDIETYKKLTEV